MLRAAARRAILYRTRFLLMNKPRLLGGVGRLNRPELDGQVCAFRNADNAPTRLVLRKPVRVPVAGAIRGGPCKQDVFAGWDTPQLEFAQLIRKAILEKAFAIAPVGVGNQHHERTQPPAASRRQPPCPRRSPLAR